MEALEEELEECEEDLEDEDEYVATGRARLLTAVHDHGDEKHAEEVAEGAREAADLAVTAAADEEEAWRSQLIKQVTRQVKMKKRRTASD
ncbi:hypothetical protein HU200_049404 [Digitaria exilis]|uniref:Uncharacterized protein n=1 Tax=Digitaria exilis TaxID=1010633 RepID=A0A835ATI0_9POAL|nr:hypothetical protein HU200_049404 [Digitaria exilis]